MKGSAVSCWLTTVSLSPARMGPLVSAAWPGPGATVLKVGNQSLPTGALCVRVLVCVYCKQVRGSENEIFHCLSAYNCTSNILALFSCIVLKYKVISFKINNRYTKESV